MAGSENFNDGASLAAKSWILISNAANVAAAGPDGSYALQNSALFGQGTMPMPACVQSTRLMVTFDWNKTAANGGTNHVIVSSNGYDPSAYGGTADFWIIKLTSTGGAGPQILTNARGGVNVWNIPDLYPPVASGWKTFRLELIFSSAVMDPGNDGTLYFGIYPGTRDETPGAGPGPTLNGTVRIWWGNDVGSLILRYELTDLGLLNPTLIGAPLPYDLLTLAPDGEIDNIVWDDFCSGAVVDNSDYCSCTPLDDSTVPTAGGIGNGAPPVLYPSIGAQIQCVGGGLVPMQADLVASELWWGN
jgi:hypothetical protein